MSSWEQFMRPDNLVNESEAIEISATCERCYASCWDGVYYPRRHVLKYMCINGHETIIEDFVA